MSKELDEFYKSYSARIIAIDDTPSVEVMDGGKFKLLSIEEYEEMTNKIADLQSQLAEKEKQLAEYGDINNALNSGLKDRCISCEEEHNQDKISFAVEQLEKIKEICKNKFEWWENSEWEGNIYDKSDVSNAYFDIEANIDQQINELKGRVEDE